MVRKYLLTLVDQGFVSIFNFALILLLIRAWEPSQFGTFVFWNTIALACVGFQNALINTPLSVFGPSAPSEAKRVEIEGVLSSANFVYLVAIFSVVLIANLVFDSNGREGIFLSLIVAVYVTSFLIREYARSVSFARHKVENVIWIDLCYLVIGSLLFSLYLADIESFNLPSVLGFLAAGSLVGGIAGLVRGPAQFRALKLTKASARQYLPIWVHTRWSLVGVTMVELKSRGYVYLVASLIGMDPLGILAAANHLFRPVHVVLTAWGRMALPHFTGMVAAVRVTRFGKTIAMFCAIFVSGLVLYCGLIYLLWPYLDDLIFQRRYDSIGWLVAGWAVVSLLGVPSAIVRIGLQSLKKFKALALGLTFGAIVTLTLISVIVLQLGYEYVPVGNSVGALVVLIIYLEILRRATHEIKSKAMEPHDV